MKLRFFNPLDIIYPYFCRACQKLLPHDCVYCDACAAKIKPIATSFVGVTPKYAIKVFAAAAYHDPLRSLLLRKNFSDRVASRQLAHIMYEKTNIKNIVADYFVPIPLHWTRYAWRGFNQSHEMAHLLCKRMNIPVLDLLQRKKRTVFQSRLSREQRRENVKDVFQIKKSYRENLRDLLHNKRIVLVDDLCTTGATLKHAARQLVVGRPKEIVAVVACRVV